MMRTKTKNDEYSTDLSDKTDKIETQELTN